MEALKRPNWDFSEKRDEKLLWLDKNECNYKSVKSFIREIYKSIDINSLSTYPDLSDIYCLFNSVFNIKNDRSFLTYGSDGAIKAFFEFCNSKSKKPRALLMRPTFGMYEVYARYYCASVSFFDYGKFTKDFNIDINSLVEEIDQLNEGDIFVLANPESPLGFLYEEKQLITLIDKCLEKKIFFLLDETYMGFSKAPYSHRDLIELNLSNVFLTGSLSKSWGLAGVRLGYLVSSKENVEDAKLTRFMYEIGGLQSEILKSCLENHSVFEKLLSEQIKNREDFIHILRHNNFDAINTSTNFIHISRKSLKGSSLTNLADICIFKQIKHSSLAHLIRLTMPDPVDFDIILAALKKQ